MVAEEHAISTTLFFKERKVLRERFHDKLLSMGVRAYRSNDGWVDRENHIITFFRECTLGYYFGMNELNVGDKIFIGDEADGGQFAIVDGIVDIDTIMERGRKYHYHLMEEYIDSSWHFSTISKAEKERRRRIRVWVKTAVCSALFILLYFLAICYITTK